MCDFMSYVVIDMFATVIATVVFAIRCYCLIQLLRLIYLCLLNATPVFDIHLTV